jgi:hypothetical protein
VANINVGELIVVNVLPTQLELNGGSITVSGVTKTFTFPVVFRINNSVTVDYTYLNAIDPPTLSFNPDSAYLAELDIDNGVLLGVLNRMVVPNGVTIIPDFANFSNKSIGYLTFTEGLISIGERSFESNTIKTIVIPSTVTSIGVRAFTVNPITAVTLPAGCTYKSTSFPVGTVVTGGILIA